MGLETRKFAPNIRRMIDDEEERESEEGEESDEDFEHGRGEEV